MSTLKEERNKRNWSQERLAHLSGVSARTIWRAEHGEPIALTTVRSLAATLGIDPETMALIWAEGNADRDIGATIEGR
jgi:transcriptional regulator with XRE-family HTH domain